MFELLTKKTKNRAKPTEKIFLTLFILFLFRFGNTIPLAGIDQEALKKSLTQLGNNNSIMQIINMYSGGGTSILTPFSLGIIPFINASIIIDLLTALFPYLEKLQSEEGELGRKKLTFYKKALTLFFATVQTIFLINYIKAYVYNTDLLNLGMIGLELVTGSMIIVWLSTIIDNKGIGNGTSLIILTNIVVTLIGKQNLNLQGNFNSIVFIEILILLLLMVFICISQTARINIDVVSARQLAFLENIEKTSISNKTDNAFQLKENGLSIRLNQAGIFPIIIASNLIPFISYLSQNLFENQKFISTILYYLLIIGFNYFYTIVFWDPEKISEQLRKASVSIVNITPGKETISYLENVVRSSSIIGGIFLCAILFFYDFIRQFINGYLLNQLNISSLIIVVGVAYEIQKTIRALYKNNLEEI
jgi:preprotein translocase subunit SecY|uniref:Preprotein translocase subunit SecY n=1 Tax=Ochromonas sp. CCMP1393 TaxID=420556 RepID=A0A0D3MKZ7_9STRA|nr:preprotein translocase subunit SecY [Ochromonas sp. CCMP1393]